MARPKRNIAKTAPPSIGEAGPDPQDGESAIDHHERQRLRRDALEPGDARDAHYEMHPVVVNDQRVITASIKEAYKIAEHALVHHATGTCFFGNFRSGKSFAQDILMAELTSTFPNVAFGSVAAIGQGAETDKLFYGQILTDLHLSTHGTREDRRERIVRYVQAKTHAAGGTRFVLFVDEAANWSVQQLSWHRDLGNTLRKSHISLITFMFGDEALLSRRDELLGRRRHDLFGRFMLNIERFRGLDSAEELREFLAAFDAAGMHEYPVGSGVCYSEFFRPRAYAQGWRLEHEAKLLWATLAEIAAEGTHKARDIGMQWIMSAVRGFLCANKDRQIHDPDLAAWGPLVLCCGYRESLVGVQ